MAHQHPTTGARHYGRRTSSLKQQVCEACNRPIWVGERFVRFDWFDGRQHSVVCLTCAFGLGTSHRREVIA